MRKNKLKIYDTFTTREQAEELTKAIKIKSKGKNMARIYRVSGRRSYGVFSKY